MNDRKLFFVLLMGVLFWTTGLHADGLLSGKYSLEELKRLLPVSNTLEIPQIEDRIAWEEAD